MLEPADANMAASVAAATEPGPELLPKKNSGKPPLPPLLRLPSLPDGPAPSALPPVAGATLVTANFHDNRGAAPAAAEDDEQRYRPSATAQAVDAATAAKRLAGLAEFLGGDRRAVPAGLPGLGALSPSKERPAGAGSAQLLKQAREQSAALRRHGDRVRGLQLAQRALRAVVALEPLPGVLAAADAADAVGALEAACAANRTRWFATQACASAHERLSGGDTTLDDIWTQQSSLVAQAKCASLLQEAASVVRARLPAELRRQAEAAEVDATRVQGLIDAADQFNVVALSLVPPAGTAAVVPIEACEELAQGKAAALASSSAATIEQAVRDLASVGGATPPVHAEHIVAQLPALRPACIVAAAMLPEGAVGLGAQLPGGHASVSAAALRCDAEAILCDHLYAISAELAPPRPPIGPSAILPSGSAPLPATLEPAVAWHLSRVGSGVVGVLRGLRARCEVLEADRAEQAAAAAQVGEVAGVAVDLFHSWAAQVFQRERCGLLELCTLHSDSLAVGAALESLRPLIGVNANVKEDALGAAAGRLAALQQAIGNHLSDGLEESAASFWELLPEKYWNPKKDDKSAAAGAESSELKGRGEAGEYMKRLVDELIAPGAKTLLKLDPATAKELLPRIVGGSLESLASHLLRNRPRFNTLGARRLRVDVLFLEGWVRKKLGDGDGGGDGGDETPVGEGAVDGGLAGTLLALPMFQRLRDAAAVLSDPEDRVARGKLTAADAQAWLALTKWRPTMKCAARSC